MDILSLLRFLSKFHIFYHALYFLYSFINIYIIGIEYNLKNINNKKLSIKNKDILAIINWIKNLVLIVKEYWI